MRKFLNKEKLMENNMSTHYNGTKEGCHMKNHKFWAWAAVICMVMAFYTGYKHK